MMHILLRDYSLYFSKLGITLHKESVYTRFFTYSLLTAFKI
jgi:hypothetical protein